jgi:hypothetical protein
MLSSHMKEKNQKIEPTSLPVLAPFIYDKFKFNLSSACRLAMDDFPTLIRHGLLPEKKNDFITWHLTYNEGSFDRQIIESDLRYSRIPYTQDDIDNMLRKRREKEFEDKAYRTRYVTLTFLFHLCTKLNRPINWYIGSEATPNTFLPKLLILPSDVVKLIASFFSFETFLIERLDSMLIGSPRLPATTMLFKPVRRESTEENPLLLAENN